MAFIASRQNPNSSQQDNVFRVTLLFSDALMDMKWNRVSLKALLTNLQATQRVILLGYEASQMSILQVSETNWGNVLGKQRNEKGNLQG